MVGVLRPRLNINITAILLNTMHLNLINRCDHALHVPPVQSFRFAPSTDRLLWTDPTTLLPFATCHLSLHLYASIWSNVVSWCKRAAGRPALPLKLLSSLSHCLTVSGRVRHSIADTLLSQWPSHLQVSNGSVPLGISYSVCFAVEMFHFLLLFVLILFYCFLLFSFLVWLVTSSIM